jgi:hypothetical protein
VMVMSWSFTAWTGSRFDEGIYRLPSYRVICPEWVALPDCPSEGNRLDVVNYIV